MIIDFNKLENKIYNEFEKYYKDNILHLFLRFNNINIPKYISFLSYGFVFCILLMFIFAVAAVTVSVLLALYILKDDIYFILCNMLILSFICTLILLLIFVFLYSYIQYPALITAVYVSLLNFFEDKTKDNSISEEFQHYLINSKILARSNKVDNISGENFLEGIYNNANISISNIRVREKYLVMRKRRGSLGNDIYKEVRSDIIFFHIKNTASLFNDVIIISPKHHGILYQKKLRKIKLPDREFSKEYGVFSNSTKSALNLLSFELRNFLLEYSRKNIPFAVLCDGENIDIIIEYKSLPVITTYNSQYFYENKLKDLIYILKISDIIKFDGYNMIQN